MADFKADGGEPGRVSGKIVVVLFVTALVLFGVFIMWKRSLVRTKLAADADAAARARGTISDGGSAADHPTDGGLAK